MKAVAVPYVIALILGVIAIGLLGYWFISQGGKTVSTGENTECKGKQFTYCLELRYSSSPSTFGLGDTCTKPDEIICEGLLGVTCTGKTGSPAKCATGETEYSGFSNAKKCCKKA